MMVLLLPRCPSTQHPLHTYLSKSYLACRGQIQSPLLQEAFLTLSLSPVLCLSLSTLCTRLSSLTRLQAPWGWAPSPIYLPHSEHRTWHKQLLNKYSAYINLQKWCMVPFLRKIQCRKKLEVKSPYLLFDKSMEVEVTRLLIKRTCSKVLLLWLLSFF